MTRATRNGGEARAVHEYYAGRSEERHALYELSELVIIDVCEFFLTYKNDRSINTVSVARMVEENQLLEITRWKR